MPLEIIAKLGGDLFLQGFDLGVDKFDNVAGMQIDQVVMMFAFGVFISGAASS